jgi:hypothetical protein
MRVYLKVSYDERFKAKSLGCRWDSHVKLWFIDNPENLKPFSQWMPSDVKEFYSEVSKPQVQTKKPKPYKQKPIKKTGPKVFKPLCNCAVEPWEDCEHTEELANKAMMEILK